VRFGAFAVSCVPVQNDAHKDSKSIASPNQQTCCLLPLGAVKHAPGPTQRTEIGIVASQANAGSEFTVKLPKKK